MAATDATAPDRQGDLAIPAVILAGLFVVLFLAARDGSSNDLRALWLAGQHYDIGTIYAGSDGIFTMTAPAEWRDGQTGAIYPYLYPPLWAAVISPFTGWLSFEVFAGLMSALHAALVVASLTLVWRLGDQPSAAAFFAIGAGLVLTGLPFALAIEENQPQIIVSFLILLAIERDRSNRPVVAGVALALAAAIKIYPALFALFWMAAGKRTEATSFGISGAFLGVLSVGLAGWPLHEAFLHEVSAISRTVLLSMANASLDPLIAALFVQPEAMTLVDTSATGGETRWLVHEKSNVWRGANLAVLILGLAALMWVARRTRLHHVLFWPLAFIVVAWLSPLSWFYHYMTAFYFLPLLLFRGRSPVLSLIFAATALLIAVPLWQFAISHVLTTAVAMQSGASLGLAMLATGAVIGLLQATDET